MSDTRYEDHEIKIIRSVVTYRGQKTGVHYEIYADDDYICESDSLSGAIEALEYKDRQNN